jgi:hypothetical protein
MILGKLPSFVGSSSLPDIRVKPAWLVVPEGERVLGVYVSEDRGSAQPVLITDAALYLDGVGNARIAYADIVDSTAYPTEGDAHDAWGVQATLRDGAVVVIPVRGRRGNDRYVDAFDFVRFLLRVTEDLRRDRIA